jgi:hypothetical protein
VIGPADVELFADWTIAFLREAVPHDPLPSRERLCGSHDPNGHRRVVSVLSERYPCPSSH